MSTNSTPVQYFFLRLPQSKTCSCALSKGPYRKQTSAHPVGVIAFTREKTEFDPSLIRVAGSMVSKKDVFDKKIGVARAIGRLKSASKSLTFTEPEFSDISVMGLLDDLNLVPNRGSSNYADDLDYDRAEKTFKKTVEVFRSRTCQPASV